MLKKLLKFIGILFLVFIIMIGTLFLLELKKAEGNPTKATIGVLEKVADSVVETEPIYVLLLGMNDNLNQSLTDTIMVLGYNPDTQKAFIISIPRDTFVGNNLSKATASDKINSLYSKNPKKIMDKVSEITGIAINYYVTINNAALIKMVDAIGGVEFDVPIDMNYDDKTQNLHIHLKKGQQLIDGKKAEQLLRFRHNNNGSSYPISYGDNDYGRMKTQREFMMAVVSKCLQSRNIDEIKEIVGIAFENIETNLSLSYILSYLVYAYNFNIANLELSQLPGKSVYTNEVWVFDFYKTETKQMIYNLLQEFNGN